VLQACIEFASAKSNADLWSRLQMAAREGCAVMVEVMEYPQDGVTIRQVELVSDLVPDFEIACEEITILLAAIRTHHPLARLDIV
jgi:hypothetical protein